MSTFFLDIRLDYIGWRLDTKGSIRRADLVRSFGISTPQASVDLAAFQATYPGVLQYDVSAKRYVFSGLDYPRREHPAKRLEGLS